MARKDREADLAYWRAYNAQRRADPVKAARDRLMDLARKKANPERNRANVAAWRQRNPDRAWASNRATCANDRAKRLGLPDRLLARDVLDLLARQPTCVVCGAGRGLDHVVALSRGGPNTPDNIQNLCHSCNSRKSQVEDRARHLSAPPGRRA